MDQSQAVKKTSNRAQGGTKSGPSEDRRQDVAPPTWLVSNFLVRPASNLETEFLLFVVYIIITDTLLSCLR